MTFPDQTSRILRGQREQGKEARIGAQNQVLNFTGEVGAMDILNSLVILRGRRWLHFVSVVLPWLTLRMQRVFEPMPTPLVPVRKNGLLLAFVSRLTIVAGFIFLLSSATSFGVLGQQFLRPSSMWTSIGVVLTWAGLFLAVWARYLLGRPIARRTILNSCSKSVSSGICVYFRTLFFDAGILVAIGGTILVIGQWRCIVGLLLVASAFIMKSM